MSTTDRMNDEQREALIRAGERRYRAEVLTDDYTDRFGFDTYDGETDDQYFQSTSEYRCKHGVYIGPPGGADHMCQWCEDGVSDAEYAAIKQAEAVRREEARHVRLDLKPEVLEHDIDITLGQAINMFEIWVRPHIAKATMTSNGVTRFVEEELPALSEQELSQRCRRVVVDMVSAELVDMQLYIADSESPIVLNWKVAEA